MGAFCRHGHPLVEANVYRDHNDTLYCRACLRIRRDRWAKAHAAAPPNRRCTGVGPRSLYFRWYYITHAGANMPTSPALLYTVLAETGREVIDPIGLELRG